MAPQLAVDWSGYVVTCMASGPSLTLEDVEVVRAWRFGAERRRVIVVNTTFRAAPWADVLYAADSAWWRDYHGEVNEVFRGERISASKSMAKGETYGARVVQVSHHSGLSRDPSVINGGGNSGYQAIGLAVARGARAIILLGYDMQRTNGESHWHGDHPPTLRQNSPLAAWVTRFPALAKDLEDDGIPVFNCSRESALTCFPRVELAAALKHEPSTTGEPV